VEEFYTEKYKHAIKEIRELLEESLYPFIITQAIEFSYPLFQNLETNADSNIKSKKMWLVNGR
jgi:hypothetical protein